MYADPISPALSEALAGEDIPNRWGQHRTADERRGPTYAEVLDWFCRRHNLQVIVYRMTEFRRIAIRRADNGILLHDVRGEATLKTADWNDAMDAAILAAYDILKKQRQKKKKS